MWLKVLGWDIFRIVSTIRHMKKEMTHYKPKETVQLHQEYEDWAVLFDRETNQSLVINPVGIVIWQALEEQETLTELANVVVETFEDVPPEIVGDVEEFVDGLIQGGFVILRGGRR